MEHTSHERNPFMLMISPEIILAAMEKSEHLSQLTSRLCRPLDRLTPPASPVAETMVEEDDGDQALHALA